MRVRKNIGLVCLVICFVGGTILGWTGSISNISSQNKAIGTSLSENEKELREIRSNLQRLEKRINEIDQNRKENSGEILHNVIYILGIISLIILTVSVTFVAALVFWRRSEEKCHKNTLPPTPEKEKTSAEPLQELNQIEQDVVIAGNSGKVVSILPRLPRFSFKRHPDPLPPKAS